MKPKTREKPEGDYRSVRAFGAFQPDIYLLPIQFVLKGVLYRTQTLQKPNS